MTRTLVIRGLGVLAMGVLGCSSSSDGSRGGGAAGAGFGGYGTGGTGQTGGTGGYGVGGVGGSQGGSAGAGGGSGGPGGTGAGGSGGTGGTGTGGTGTGGSGGTGGSCASFGDYCATSGACCASAAGSGSCVNWTTGATCTQYCTTGSGCPSGCCLPLPNDPHSVCSPASYCGSGGSGGSGGTGGTGAGGSGGTGGSGGAANHTVTCTSTGHISPEWCHCTGDSNTGSTVFSGSCKKDPTFAPMTCCASTSFPGSGSCTCYLNQPWRCEAFTTSCYCDYWTLASSQYLTSVCDNVPAADGHPWRCCQSSAGSCNCAEDGPACAAGYTEVANCGSDVNLGLTPFYGCGAGQTAVSGCSNVGSGGSGNCTSDSQCPGSCTGSDPVCCPVCKSTGNCGMYCCGSSGCF